MLEAKGFDELEVFGLGTCFVQDAKVGLSLVQCLDTFPETTGQSVVNLRDERCAEELGFVKAIDRASEAILTNAFLRTSWTASVRLLHFPRRQSGPCPRPNPLPEPGDHPHILPPLGASASWVVSTSGTSSSILLSSTSDIFDPLRLVGYL